jgi:hypothetical protein
LGHIDAARVGLRDRYLTMMDESFNRQARYESRFDHIVQASLS